MSSEMMVHVHSKDIVKSQMSNPQLNVDLTLLSMIRCPKHGFDQPHCLLLWNGMVGLWSETLNMSSSGTNTFETSHILSS